MLDILVSLIEDLFGTKKAPPAAQPGRQGRQPGQQAPTGTTHPEPQAVDNRPDYGNPWLDHPTTPVGQTNPPEFEKMVRQFFGMEEEPPAPPPQPQPPAHARMVADPVAVSSIADSIAKPLRGTFAVSAALDDSVTSPVAAIASGEKRPLREMVRGLRNNPHAAREAFLYAEIFGPPLANKH